MVIRSELICLRRARDRDAAALAGVFSESWRQAYTGIIPAMSLDVLVRRRDAAWWQRAVRTEAHLIVLQVEDRVVGYATCGPGRATPPRTGEIFELYLTPVYQGVGLGEHLFEACRHTLDGLHLPHMTVWALAENTAACEFYRRRGGRVIGRSSERFGHVVLDKLAFGW